MAAGRKQAVKEIKKKKKNCFNFQVNSFPCRSHAGVWIFGLSLPCIRCFPVIPTLEHSGTLGVSCSGTGVGPDDTFGSLPTQGSLWFPNYLLVGLFGVFLAETIYFPAMGSVSSSWFPPDFQKNSAFPSSLQLCSTRSCCFPNPLCLPVPSYQAQHSATGPRAWYFIYFDLYN